ncbi:MAG: EamA family transporter RarD [Phycisphaerales bacterium]|nr:EamA family transporter RarD [Phycisphaerales bacterium]
MSRANHTPADSRMGSASIGLAQIIFAYLWWGFATALYYWATEDAPAFELLALRVVTGLPILLLLVALPPGFHRIKDTFRDPRNMALLSASTVCIAINWFGFIFAVVNRRLTEASLGYFLLPLFTVLLGRVFLGERLHRLQVVAIVIAVAGVMVFCASIFTEQDGETPPHVPWVPFVIAFTFGIYGLLRKQMKADSVTGLTIELIFLAPLMVGIEIFFFAQGSSGFTNPDLGIGTKLLMLCGGLVTAIPLLLYAAAAKRLRLSTIGVLQYIAPTCQFLLAVLVFGEPFGLVKGIAFGLIWTAVILYSVNSVRIARAVH